MNIPVLFLGCDEPTGVYHAYVQILVIDGVDGICGYERAGSVSLVIPEHVGHEINSRGVFPGHSRFVDSEPLPSFYLCVSGWVLWFMVVGL